MAASISTAVMHCNVIRISEISAPQKSHVNDTKLNTGAISNIVCNNHDAWQVSVGSSRGDRTAIRWKSLVAVVMRWHWYIPEKKQFRIVGGFRYLIIG